MIENCSSIKISTLNIKRDTRLIDVQNKLLVSSNTSSRFSQPVRPINSLSGPININRSVDNLLGSSSKDPLATENKNILASSRSMTTSDRNSMGSLVLQLIKPQKDPKLLSSLFSKAVAKTMAANTPTAQPTLRILPKFLCIKYSEPEQQEVTDFLVDLAIFRRFEWDGCTFENNELVICFIAIKNGPELNVPSCILNNCFLSLHMPQSSLHPSRQFTDDFLMDQKQRMDLIEMHYDCTDYVRNIVNVIQHTAALSIVSAPLIRDITLYAKCLAVLNNSTAVRPDYIVDALYQVISHRLNKSSSTGVNVEFASKLPGILQNVTAPCW